MGTAATHLPQVARGDDTDKRSWVIHVHIHNYVSIKSLLMFYNYVNPGATQHSQTKTSILTMDLHELSHRDGNKRIIHVGTKILCTSFEILMKYISSSPS